MFAVNGTSELLTVKNTISRSHWPHFRRSAAARLLGLRVRIPPVALMSVLRVVCQAEVSALGISLAQRSIAECDVSECDREASIKRKPQPTRGCCVMGKKDIYIYIYIYIYI